MTKKKYTTPPSITLGVIENHDRWSALVKSVNNHRNKDLARLNEFPPLRSLDKLSPLHKIVVLENKLTAIYHENPERLPPRRRKVVETYKKKLAELLFDQLEVGGGNILQIIEDACKGWKKDGLDLTLTFTSDDGSNMGMHR